MKLTTASKPFTILAMLAYAPAAHAAIAWDTTTAPTSIAAGNTVTFNPDLNDLSGEWAGLDLEFFSSVDASLALEVGPWTDNKARIDWSPTNSITGGSGGTDITIGLSFSQEMWSAPRVVAGGQNSRAAFLVRQLSGSIFDNDMSIRLITETSDTLEGNFFNEDGVSNNSPFTVGDTTYTQDGTAFGFGIDINDDGTSDETATSEFVEFSDPNTLRLSTPAATNHLTSLLDPDRTTQSFHYKGFDVILHLDEGETLQSDAVFRFTIEGDDITGDAVPEPASTALLGLGLIALAVRRKR